MKSCSRAIIVISAISREIMPKVTIFSLKITKNTENCHSWISRFLQMVKREIMFMLDSHKFWSKLNASWNRCYDFWDIIEFGLSKKKDVAYGNSCLKWIEKYVFSDWLQHDFLQNIHIHVSECLLLDCWPKNASKPVWNFLFMKQWTANHPTFSI